MVTNFFPQKITQLGEHFVQMKTFASKLTGLFFWGKNVTIPQLPVVLLRFASILYIVRWETSVV